MKNSLPPSMQESAATAANIKLAAVVCAIAIVVIGIFLTFSI